MTQRDVPLAYVRDLLAGLVQRSGLLALGLAFAAAGGCALADGSIESTSSAGEALTTPDCGFRIDARVCGVSKKGFNASISVKNVSAARAKDFTLFVDVGDARIVHVAGGTVRRVAGGYLLKPRHSLKHRRLDPGETYRFHLKLRGQCSHLNAHMVSTHGDKCDETAPTVSLSASSDFFTADGTLTLTAEAADDIAVRKVVFRQDDEVVGVDRTAPYTLDVPVTSALNGRHSYEAIAYDLVGNTASETESVLVAIDNKFFGTAVTSAADYPNLLTYFNQVTPGNAGKWGSVEAVQDVMNWADLDSAYDFAKSNGLPFKLHTLVWGQQQPSWLSALSTEEQLGQINEWFDALAERYQDIDLIDVVNEPLHAPPSYKEALGGDGETGWDWVITAFEMAREHFPKSELILNEYSVLQRAETTANFLSLVGVLEDRGLIDGIGEQGHFYERSPELSVIETNLDTLAASGLPIYVSELDINFANDARHAVRMSELFPIFWDNPSVVGVTHWGYRQGTMWQPDSYLLRTDGSERPALTWLECYIAGGTDCYVPEYVPEPRVGDANGIVLEAEDFDDAAGLLAAGPAVGYASDGSWLSFSKVTFDDNWDSASVSYAKPGTVAVNLSIHLGSLDNAPVAVLPLGSTADWNTYATVSIPWAPISGEQDVFVRFNGGGANVDKFEFSAPAGTGPNVVPNSDFEQADTGGWENLPWVAGSASTNLVAQTTARAVSGSGSLAQTARTTSAALYKYLGNVLMPGKTYDVSLWAGIGGVASASVNVTRVIQCADGSGPGMGWMGGSQTVADGAWVEFTGKLEIPDCPLGWIAIWVEGPPAGVDLYLDHVSIRAEQSANIVPNGTFESGTSGWWTWGSGTLTATDARAHGGTKSLLVSRPSASDNTPAVIDLTALVEPGVSYPFSVWVSMDSTDGSSKQVNVTRGFNGDVAWVGSPVMVADDGSWVEITGVLDIPDTTLSSIMMWIEGAAGAALYIDDVQVMANTGGSDNLISDGTFESGQGAWWGYNCAVSVADGYAYSGDKSLEGAACQSNGMVGRDIQPLVEGGKRYQATAWVSVGSIASGLVKWQTVQNCDGAGDSYPWLDGKTVDSGTWQQVSGVVDLTGCTSVDKLILFAGADSGDVYVDDVTLTPLD